MAIAANMSQEDNKDEHEHDMVMPGFRFHPTEEELVEFYLRRKVEGKRFNVELITSLDLYRYDPWELPGTLFYMNSLIHFHFLIFDALSTFLYFLFFFFSFLSSPCIHLSCMSSPGCNWREGMVLLCAQRPQVSKRGSPQPGHHFWLLEGNRSWSDDPDRELPPNWPEEDSCFLLWEGS